MARLDESDKLKQMLGGAFCKFLGARKCFQKLAFYNADPVCQKSSAALGRPERSSTILGTLGRSWEVSGPLGRSWSGLGAVLGRSWRGLWALLGGPGASWARLELVLARLVRS